LRYSALHTRPIPPRQPLQLQTIMIVGEPSCRSETARWAELGDPLGLEGVICYSL
jgi:hypothetical protein